jgi:hypothetical protein
MPAFAMSLVILRGVAIGLLRFLDVICLLRCVLPTLSVSNKLMRSFVSYWLVELAPAGAEGILGFELSWLGKDVRPLYTV